MLVSQSACAKLILLGEHAVVYGFPALAIPFSSLRVRASVEPDFTSAPGTLTVIAPEKEAQRLKNPEAVSDLIKKACKMTLRTLNLTQAPTCVVRVRSEIPFASGLGSSAAVSVAVARALSAFLGHPLPVEEVNAVAFQTEQLTHGSPSGIDNTVIAYEQPIFFQKTQTPMGVHPGKTFTFLVADSGVQKSTMETVSRLAQRRTDSPQEVEPVLTQIGLLAQPGLQALEEGDEARLGSLMNQNQTLLSSLGLSCEALDRMIEAALSAGAIGAKLTGGGQGGHMLALVPESAVSPVKSALSAAGSPHVYLTTLKPAEG
jgi:mevalonate kinase